MKYNATCEICGNPYFMCLSCKDMVQAKPWQIHTDTAEHYKIYQVLHGYNFGVYTKEEAKEKLSNLDLSGYESFNETVVKMIKQIMKENTPMVEAKTETVEVKETPVENDDIDTKSTEDKTEKEIDIVEDVKTDIKNAKEAVKADNRKSEKSFKNFKYKNK